MFLTFGGVKGINLFCCHVELEVKSRAAENINLENLFSIVLSEPMRYITVYM